MNSKKKIAIFVDHDIIIRHFLKSKVFEELTVNYHVDVILPQKGYKRIKQDISDKDCKLNILRFPVFDKSISIWGRFMQAKIFKLSLSKKHQYIRTSWKLIVPRKGVVLFTLLGLPIIFTIFKIYTKILSHLNPNLELEKLIIDKGYNVLINPGLINGHYINDLIIISKKINVPLIFIMNSWDNPTACYFSAGKPDLFLAWGAQTVNHAIQYQNFEAKNVIPFGAAQFEIYRERPKFRKPDFCKAHKINPRKKVILYAGGSLGTNEFEHLLLLEEAIQNKKIQNISVVYRPHPWGGGGNYGEKIIDYKWKNIVIEKSMFKYLINLRDKGYHMTYPDYKDTHSILCSVDAVISPLSTILIEAAMHGKPIMCFLPIEDVNSIHFQTVHRLPHFIDLQKNENVILSKGRKELINKFPLLLKKIDDENIDVKMKKMSQFFVSSFKNSYAERLEEILESKI